MNALGSRLKSLRKGKRINQATLGELLGVSKVSISGYENGTREPDITSLIKLANYFNVTVDYLIDRNDIDINKKTEIMTFSTNNLNEDDIKEIKSFIDFKKIRRSLSKYQ